MRRLLLALLAVGLLDLATSLTWTPVASVLTGSMAPAIDPGDAVVLGRVERRLGVGDVVRIQVPASGRRLGFPATVVHRIVDIRPDGTMTTQGDARTETDPFPVSAADVDGRVLLRIPKAGLALRLLGSPPVLVWLIGGGVLLSLVTREEDELVVPGYARLQRGSAAT